MSKLKRPLHLQSAFAEYAVDEILGEGGAGRVYGGTDAMGAAVAIKILSAETSNKRKRFKNEMKFLFQSNHRNILRAIDYGVLHSDNADIPFYVMKRYKQNLRELSAILRPESVLSIFSQILDGVEAAHMLGVIHRDLKPENILCNDKNEIVIADFGIASFEMDQLATIIATGAAERLANFQYAAPEQRKRESKVGVFADIYALGLILNEIYTGAVAHGTSYTLISQVCPDLSYLDRVVDRMLKQNPLERYESIADIKNYIRRYEFEAVTAQKLDRINRTVVSENQLDDPLAYDPPQITSVFWRDGLLHIALDRFVSTRWLQTMYYNLGSHTSVVDSEPQKFQFNGNQVTAPASERSAQMVIDHFKSWLPQTSRQLKHPLEIEQQMRIAREKQELERQRATEEQNLRVNSSLHF